MISASVPIGRDPRLFEIMAVVKREADLEDVRREIDRGSKSFKRTGRSGQIGPREAPRQILASDGDGFAGRRGAGAGAVRGRYGRHRGDGSFFCRRRPGDAGGRDARRSQVFCPQQANRGCLERNPAVKYATTILVGLMGVLAVATARAAESAELLPQSQCVLLPVAADPTISFRLWFKVGSQDDPRGKEGLAELTASMLTEGSTSNMPTRRSWNNSFRWPAATRPRLAWK